MGATPIVADLEPQTKAKPKTRDHTGDHHDGPFPGEGATPDSLRKAGLSLASGTMRHPAASAQRAATMLQMQKGMGNKFAQDAARRAAGNQSKVPASRPANPRDKLADAQAVKPGHKPGGKPGDKPSPPTASNAAHGSRTSHHGGAQSAPTAAKHDSGDKGHATQAPAASPAANAAAITVKTAVAPAPSPPDLPFTVTPEALPPGGLAAPRLDLKVAPEKPVPGQGQQPARDSQEDVRSATEAFAALVRDANHLQRSLIERADAVNAAIVNEGRENFLQVDVAIDADAAATRQKAQGHRAFLRSTSDDALKALEKQHHLARVTLSGAAGSARKNLATARAAVDKGIDDITKKLLGKFQDQFNAKADNLTKKTKETTEKLLSPQKQVEVGSTFKGQETMFAEVRPAQAEAQAAAVTPIFKQLAVDLTKSSQDQVDFLKKDAINAVPKGGDSVSGTVHKFGNQLRAGAVGEDAAHPVPPPPATAEPAKPEKHKRLPLFVQGEHAVNSAFSQAWQAIEQQFKAAKDAILYARDNATVAVDGQEVAALAQLATVRRGAKEAIANAARSGVHSVAMGVRAALPAYDEAMQRSAKALTDAGVRGQDALRRVREEGLTGVEHSIRAALETQLRQLEGIHTSITGSLQLQSQQAGKAAAEVTEQIQTGMAAMIGEAAKTVQGYATSQVEGLSALAKSVSGSAAAYSKPMAILFKDSVDKVNEAWFPDETIKKDVNGGSDGKAAATGPAQKTPEETLQEYSEKPETKIVTQEDKVADELAATVERKAGTAFQAIDKTFNMDEDGLLAALHGLTALQGKAVEFFYGRVSGGGNLRDRLWSEYDKYLRGLNKNEYHAAINYLNGNASAGALWELKETAGIWSDGKRAEAILRDLTADQRKQLVSRPDWPAVSGRVRDGLSGNDLDVFDALSASKVNRADAIRFKQNVDSNRESDDKDAFAKTLEGYHPAGDTEAERKANFEDMKKEFADLPGVRKLDEAPNAKTSTALFKDYITRDVTVYISAGEGESMPVTYKVEGADLALAEAIAVDGPGSKNAKAARVLREARRTDGKPELEPLENAVVDPRLNPSLNRGVAVDKETRAKILREQDEIYMASAEMARKYGLGSTATTPKEAREEAAKYLKSHYDRSTEKGEVGAQYVESIVKEDVPDGVLGIRYAILGPGTDEALIHRTFGRMSRKEVDAARGTYKQLFHGDDMDSDLGTDGSWGDLSGNDKLQAQREMYGVPQNDKENFELALYTIQQQKDANTPGSTGSSYNKDSAQEKAMLSTEKRLLEAAGGTLKKDDFGRTVIEGGNFNPDGSFSGPNNKAVLTDINLASITAENYSARLDELSDFVVGVIAIIGAVIATAATAGGASPLILVAIAGATGAATMLAKQDIRGGRYGWEEAGVDLGMTAVQMIGAGVGASLGKALGTATKAAEEAAMLAGEGGAQAARNAATQAVKINIARRATDAAITGAATGAIHGLGTTALNEQTWEKGIGAGLGNVVLGTVKGSFTGAASGAVTGAIDASPFGQKLQNLAFEGGMVKSVSNMLLRGAGQSIVSTAGGLVGTGTDLAFDAATGKFKGSWHDAMNTLQIAGRDAAIRGFFEGQGASIGHAYHNQTVRAAEEKQTAARRALAAIDLEKTPLSAELVESLPAGPNGKPGTVEIHLDENGAPIMRMTKSATLEEQQQAVLGFLAVWQSARAEFQAPPAQQGAEDTETLNEAGTRRAPAPDETNGTTPSRPQQESDLPSTEVDATSARQRRTDESAAAGIAGSRFTGDAARRFGTQGIRESDIDPALAKLTEGLLAGKVSASGNEERPISLKTNAVANNGEPVEVRIKIKVVELDQMKVQPGEEIPVAQFEREGDSDYVIRLSKGAMKDSAERGLAHELTEIQHLHKPLAEGSTDLSLPEQEHALQAGSKATTLSGHDRGRMAEIEVLARRANPDTPEGRRAMNEVQRLAQELGLIAKGQPSKEAIAKAKELGAPPPEPEASAAVLARRNLTRQPLQEGGPDPLSPLARAALDEAIASAAKNPFLKPLTGEPENDVPILADRLAAAKRNGDISQEDIDGLPRTIDRSELEREYSQPSDLPALRRKNPVLLETIEQLRQLMAGEGLISFKKQAASQHAALTKRGWDLRPAEGTDLRKLFDLAQTMASKPGAWKTWRGDVSVDPDTVAAVKARWGDSKNFQEWSEFKARYLQANSRQANEPGEEFNRLERLRYIFQEWASGQYMPKGARFPSTLETPDLRPTAGYEARFQADFEGETHAGKIKIAESEIEASFTLKSTDQEETSLPAKDALLLRKQLLDEATALRTDAENLANKDLGKAKTAEELESITELIKQKSAEARAKVGQAVRVTEAIGEVAGRVFAKLAFPDGEVKAYHGPGVPDLIVRIGGRIIVIECKGGSADLGTRKAVDAEGEPDPTRRVEQGKFEYLQSLGRAMANSGDTEISQLGSDLLEQINQPGFEYYLVKQPINIDGTAAMPVVEKFDMTAGPWKPTLNASPETATNETGGTAASDTAPPLGTEPEQ